MNGLAKKNENTTQGKPHTCERCGKKIIIEWGDTDTELCLKCQETVYLQLGGDY